MNINFQAKDIDFLLQHTFNEMVASELSNIKVIAGRVYMISVEALMDHHIQHYQESHMR